MDQSGLHRGQKEAAAPENSDVGYAIAVPIAHYRFVAGLAEGQRQIRIARRVGVAQQKLSRRRTKDSDGVGESRADLDDKGIEVTVVERLQSPRRRLQIA